MQFRQVGLYHVWCASRLWVGNEGHMTHPWAPLNWHRFLNYGSVMQKYSWNFSSFMWAFSLSENGQGFRRDWLKIKSQTICFTADAFSFEPNRIPKGDFGRWKPLAENNVRKSLLLQLYVWLPQHFTKIFRFFNGSHVQLFMAGHERVMGSEAFLVLIKLSSREKFSNYKTCIMLRTIFGKAQNKHLQLRSAVCCLATTRYQKLSMGLFNYLTLWIAIGWECDLEYD